jgi:exodeoxyribonuclease VII small subunit
LQQEKEGGDYAPAPYGRQEVFSRARGQLRMRLENDVPLGLRYDSKPLKMTGMMSKTGKTPAPKDFECALAEMESLVNDMESGAQPLEASLAAYKRGMELAAYCQKVLADAESQIKILENGLLKDFDPTTVGQDAND